MYVRRTTRRYKEKVYTNYLLVESVHTPKGPRQKVICSLGDLSPRPAAAWLQLARRVEQALVGQGNLFESDDAEVAEVVRRARRRQPRAQKAPAAPASGAAADERVSVRTDRLRLENPREAGPVHVGLQFWKRLGLSDILLSAGLSPRAVELSCAMTLNRLIQPASEHAMPAWIRSTALGDLLGGDWEALGEDSLYENLDRLYPRRAAIEAQLAERERSLFNLEPSLFFYDLTSTYFEGQALANPKAKRGYSRDQRPECKQVVIGLAIGREGFPLAHEVFDGNVQDRQTLAAMLEVLTARVGLPEGATVVVDRGMAYAENLAELRRRKLHYVVAARQAERDRWLAEFEEDKSFIEVHRQPSPNNPCQRKSQVRVQRRTWEEETYILCLSSERVEKDRAIRTKQEERLLADLEKLGQRIARGRLKKELKIGEAIGRLKERYPRVARYYHLSYDAAAGKLGWEVDQQRKAKAESLDGGYLLRSSRTDLSAEEAWRLYMTLTRAEAAFRTMKSPLAERPIFHQLAHRVETHIFLCLLAYHLLVAIETTLRSEGTYTSWATVRQALATHQITTVVLPTDDGRTLRIRRATTPEPQHLELYRQLDVPTEIMEPIKTWSDPATAAPAAEPSD